MPLFSIVTARKGRDIKVRCKRRNKWVIGRQLWEKNGLDRGRFWTIKVGRRRRRGGNGRGDEGTEWEAPAGVHFEGEPHW